MVSPMVSRYDTSPWQPTIDTSSSDVSDQQAAAAQYNQVYGGSAKSADGSKPPVDNPPWADMPSVYMAYTQAPDFVPTASSQGTPSDISNADVLDTMPFYIELAALRTTEQAFLNATSAAIDDYNTLKGIVTAATLSQTIFGQHVGETLVDGQWMDNSYVNTPYHSTDDPYSGNPYPTSASPLNPEGQDFANSTDPAMTQVCSSICAVLELWGVFTALLNNTGQMFTYTDSNCRFPPIMNPTMHSG
jgi:hypothetical protein